MLVQVQQQTTINTRGGTPSWPYAFLAFRALRTLKKYRTISDDTQVRHGGQRRLSKWCERGTSSVELEDV